ncbi:hypothetical protein I3760_08G018100 [Carya illinoinensis]|nr:hypothetical protein I3760_08G018100 [Carya illinoinensis]
MMKMRKELRVRYAMQRFDQAKGRGQWDFTDGESTMEYQATVQFIPFSAFWLRSSVVSVLISLISDTWGRPITVACYWGLRASPMRCTIARAWRTPPKPS